MRRYVGVDLHKAFVMVVVVDAQQTVVQSALRIQLSDLEAWAAQALTSEDEVALEATANAWLVYDRLSRSAGRVVVSNPNKTALIAQAQVKSDQVDAVILARLLAAQFLYTVWVPPADVRQQRALVAHRSALRQLLTQTQNWLHALLRSHDRRCPFRPLFSAEGREWLEHLALRLVETLERQHLLQQFDLLAQQLDQTDRQIAELVQHDLRVTHLLQLTGMGYYTAFAILATVGDIRRFATADQLTSYSGLVPQYHQSGSTAYAGRITKAGPSTRRWLLVEAAPIAVRHDPHWQRTWEEIKRRRGSKVAWWPSPANCWW